MKSHLERRPAFTPAQAFVVQFGRDMQELDSTYHIICG